MAGDTLKIRVTFTDLETGRFGYLLLNDSSIIFTHLICGHTQRLISRNKNIFESQVGFVEDKQDCEHRATCL